MSYSTVETALETLLKTVSGYGAANVSKSDERILGTGQDKALILYPGPFRRENLPPGVANTEWEIQIALCIPYRGEIPTFGTTIRTERQAIVDKLDKYPTLNREAGVLLGAMESGDEPELWSVGSITYWRQVLRVRVRETVVVTYAE